MRFKKEHTFRNTVFGKNGIGIQEQDVFALRNLKPLVTSLREALVIRVVNKVDLWKFGEQVFHAPVGRGVIDNNYLSLQGGNGLPDREKTLLKEVLYVEIYYDD